MANTFVSRAIAARTYNAIRECRLHGWLRGKSRSDPLRRPIFMWRTQEREFGKKVFMGSHVIAGDLALREDAKENVNRVVGECRPLCGKTAG